MSSLSDCLDDECVDLVVARAHRKPSNEPASFNTPSDLDPSLVIGLVVAAAVLILLAVVLLLWVRKKKFAREDPEGGKNGTNPSNTFLLPHITEVTSQVGFRLFISQEPPILHLFLSKHSNSVIPGGTCPPRPANASSARVDPAWTRENGAGTHN